MKERTVKIRMTDDLFNTLLIKAKASNLNNSEYIRQSITNSDIKANFNDSYLDVVNEIKKVGNNINQISKALNIANLSKHLSDYDYENLLNELVIIGYQINQLKEK